SSVATATPASSACSACRAKTCARSSPARSAARSFDPREVPLNIIVCMKQVPDTTAEKQLNPDGTLDRASVPAVVNPWDEYAIETALRIREAQGGEVTLLCMGP